jgi:hypothetical protein
MNRSVFISSTYEDLMDYRRKAWETLRTFAADVRGMEEFGARKEAPLETCLAEVDQCDVFVGIVAFRLGSVDDESGKSFTQREYERAYDLNKELRIYLMDENVAVVPARFVDRDERHLKLDDFKRLLRDRHTVATFGSPDDLAKKLENDLRQLLTSRASQPAEQQDDFAQSADVLRNFLLVPAQYSGQQVRVTLKIDGHVFPASREICDAFQLSFGRTVGVRVSIQTPSGFKGSGLDELFCRAERVAQLLVPVNSLLDVHADLQFCPKQIGRVAARFKAEGGGYAAFSFLSPNILGNPQPYYEADSKIALLLSDVVGTQVAGQDTSGARTG